MVASLKAYAHSKDLLHQHLTKEEEITGSPLVAGNRVMLLEDGPNTYTAMVKVMQSAKDHINMETFIFDDDVEDALPCDPRQRIRGTAC